MVGVTSIIEATLTREVSSVDHPETKPGPKLSSIRFPLRWGEMDALGHINNAAYLRYFEESRVAWSASLGIHLDGKGEDHQVPGARKALGHAYGGGAQYYSMWVVSSDKPADKPSA